MSWETSPEQTPSLEIKMGTGHRTVSFINVPIPTCSHYLLPVYSLIMVFYFLLSPPFTPKDIFLGSMLLPLLHHFPHFCHLLSVPSFIYQTLAARQPSMSAMKSSMLSLAFWAHQPVQESSFSNDCHSDPFCEPTKQASWLMLVKGSIEYVSKTLSPWCMLAQSTHFHSV